MKGSFQKPSENANPFVIPDPFTGPPSFLKPAKSKGLFKISESKQDEKSVQETQKLFTKKPDESENLFKPSSTNIFQSGGQTQGMILKFPKQLQF